jgi:hypothetical protein
MLVGGSRVYGLSRMIILSIVYKIISKVRQMLINNLEL